MEQNVIKQATTGTESLEILKLTSQPFKNVRSRQGRSLLWFEALPGK